MELALHIERWPFRQPFHITGFVFAEAEVLVATLRQGDFTGRGEANGVYYHDESAARMRDQIEAARPRIEAGIDRTALQELLPAGGARDALDCALWDLDARRSGTQVWQLAGVPQPIPLRTTFTVGADTPGHMAAAARECAHARAIKLKLTGQQPAACVAAVRAARPDVWLGVDANEGLDRRSLEALLPALVAADVGLIEQPLPRGTDERLRGLESPIPLAADESVQGFDDIGRLASCYDVVNIKLDKCGGLTEGLRMAGEARRLGLRVMVGCMNGTSLAMAPAFVLGQLCDFVDLDAPTFLAHDREPAVQYDDGELWCSEAVWGAAA